VVPCWVSLPAAVSSRAKRCRTVELKPREFQKTGGWTVGMGDNGTYTCATIPINPEDITGSSAVGGIRFVIRCVGAAWRRFCRDKREVIIRT